MIFKNHNPNINNLAQSATELAVFGAVLVFVLGLLIKYTLSFHYTQGLQAQSFRKALVLALGGTSGSVTMIEDRDMPDVSSSLPVSQRTEYLGSGSANCSNILFNPLGYGDPAQIPLMDIYINGKHYSFRLADYRTYNYPYSVNYPGVVRRKVGRFDDDFKQTEDASHQFEAGLDPNTVYWQWYIVRPDSHSIDVETGKNTFVDVDGDGKEERVAAVVTDYRTCSGYVCDKDSSGQLIHPYDCKGCRESCCREHCNTACDRQCTPSMGRQVCQDSWQVLPSRT